MLLVWERMAEISPNIRSVLVLMEQELAAYEAMVEELNRRLIELAQTIDVEIGPHEDGFMLVQRVRRLARVNSSGEQPLRCVRVAFL